jgi:hypothetical protein
MQRTLFAEPLLLFELLLHAGANAKSAAARTDEAKGCFISPYLCAARDSRHEIGAR